MMTGGQLNRQWKYTNDVWLLNADGSWTQVLPLHVSLLLICPRSNCLNLCRIRQDLISSLLEQITRWFCCAIRCLLLLDKSQVLSTQTPMVRHTAHKPQSRSHFHADVWVSSDLGLTWTQLVVDGASGVFARRSSPAVAALSNTIVLVGGNLATFTWVSDVWTSTDGAHWKQLAPIPALLVRFRVLVRVIACCRALL